MTKPLSPAQSAAVVAELRRVRRWVNDQTKASGYSEGYNIAFLEYASELTRRIERLTKGRK